MTSNAVVVPEKKSPIFDVFFRNLPYPLAAAIVRGIKVALGIILPALVGALGDGTLISTIHVLPPSTAALVGMISAPIAIGIEKYVRERGLMEDIGANNPTSFAGNGPPEQGFDRMFPTDIVEAPDQDVVPAIDVDNSTVTPAVIVQPADTPTVDQPIVIKDNP